MRVAGIDCGTNSIRLLIADVEPEVRLGAQSGVKHMQDIVRRMEIVRLGAGVDRTGKFAASALARTLEAVDDYVEECQKYGVESIRFAATSATRDAGNRSEFLTGVYERLGVYPQVLTGKQEAETSFIGALSALSLHEILPVARAEDLLLTVDLGGGSTEFTLGDSSGRVRATASMDIGSVRMRERHLHSDPPTEAEIAAARKDIQRALDEVAEKVDFSLAAVLVGLAGTITSLTAFSLGLESYEPVKIHNRVLSVREIEIACDWFLAASPQQRQELGFLHSGRVDVISAGALVWQEIVRRIVADTAEGVYPINSAITSEHDILDGMALWAAREPQPPA